MAKPANNIAINAISTTLSYMQTFTVNTQSLSNSTPISMWLWDAENKKETIPPPSETLPHEKPQFINFVRADTEAYRRENDKRAVKKP